MRISKYILTGFYLMIAAILYVHQGIEIIKAGYDLENSKRSLSILVDENSNLIRDLSKLESPCNILSTIGVSEIKFAGQRAHLSNTYVLSKRFVEEELHNDGFVDRIMDVFTVSAEASSVRNLR